MYKSESEADTVKSDMQHELEMEREFRIGDCVYFDYNEYRVNIPGKIIRFARNGSYDIAPVGREWDTFFWIPAASIRRKPAPVVRFENMVSYEPYHSVQIEKEGYKNKTGVVCYSPYTYLFDGVPGNFMVAFLKEDGKDFELVDVHIDEMAVVSPP